MIFLFQVNRLVVIIFLIVSEIIFNHILKNSTISESFITTTFFASFSFKVTTTILNNNIDGDINFKGFLVGNPYVDDKSNTDAQFSSMYAHGLIALPVYQNLKRSCSIPEGDAQV